MIPTLQDGLGAAFILAATVIIAVAINVARARARQRTQELRSAGIALTAHYDAVSRLVEDPAFPDEHKAAVALFTEGLSNEEVSRAFVASFADNLKLAGGREITSSRQNFEALYQARPDLALLYQTAVLSGLASTFLRWPGNSALFQQVAVELASDVRKEDVAARRLVDLARRQSETKRANRYEAPSDLKVA